MSKVSNKKKLPHRGRVQAQGGRPELEASEAWKQAVALLLKEGLDLLEKLKNKITPTQREERITAFEQAATYMNVCADAGGRGPGKKTFPPGSIRKTDPRVDIEVSRGHAFVREQ